jgi:hypothetical protein
LDGAKVSEFVEIINPRTMTAKLLLDGQVTAEYKIEQCDACKLLIKFDSAGYQVADLEKVMWLCTSCRPTS